MREKKEINVSIGERIKYSRETAGITQEKLANLINVTVQYISALERGLTGISVPTLIRLCMTLHISSDFILLDRKIPLAMSQEFRRLECLNDEQKELVTRGINVMMDAMTMSK